MQFTTRLVVLMKKRHCFQRAKVQDLDAIHNSELDIDSILKIVFKEQKYKI